MSLHNLHTQMEAMQQAANIRASEGRAVPNINRDNSPLLPMSHPRGMPPNPSQRFMHMLASLMHKRGTALPQSITGIATHEHNPMWNPILHPGTEPGSFRLAGKDISIHKLWAIVTGQGGYNAFQSRNSWPALLQHFDLPSQSPEVLPFGNHFVPDALAQTYHALLVPLENFVQLQRQKAMQASQQPPFPSPSTPTNQPFVPTYTPTPSAELPQSNTTHPQSALKPEVFPLETEPSDGSSTPMKRKSDSEDETKRARQKLESAEPSMPPAPSQEDGATPSKAQPSRRKIEYVPLAREVDTYGGHNMEEVTAHFMKSRPLREMVEWGMVDIEALTLSLRSRLAVELSYSLTMFSILSIMRSPQPDAGFLVEQAPDLFLELLDCLEEMAFGDEPDSIDDSLDQPIVTNKQLLDHALHVESQAFASLHTRPGPMPSTIRKSHYILVMMNILRNLSVVTGNAIYFARNRRLLSVLLRLCGATRSEGGQPNAVSPALEIGDLVAVRRDCLYILYNISPYILFSPDDTGNLQTQREIKRSFNLLASYLIDPTECVSPLGLVHMVGRPVAPGVQPPALAEVALGVMTRMGSPDTNRESMAKCLSETWLWTFVEALVHRLPISDPDFAVCQNEQWLSYIDKILFALYTIAFLAPPSFKKRVKKDKRLSIPTLLLRIMHKFMAHPNRATQGGATRRAIETLKILDDAMDLFDNGKVDAPILSFGMGYGEGSEAGIEHGTGLLGSRRDQAFEFLMQGEILGDITTFRELDSLARIEL